MLSYRTDILQYVFEQYQIMPDYPWKSAPNHAVLRHLDNKKWFGLIMNIPQNKIGFIGKETIDILNIKCDPILIASLRMQKGFLPAYHMNKGNWITILLDHTVKKETIFSLLDLSFNLTK